MRKSGAQAREIAVGAVDIVRRLHRIKDAVDDERVLGVEVAVRAGHDNRQAGRCGGGLERREVPGVAAQA